MGWLDKWWKKEEDPVEEAEHDHSGGPLPSDNGDWVVLPYRIAEACRISLMTVGSHPAIPDEVRVWIAQWLSNYNAALSMYFQENYGEDIFPVLTEITQRVRNLSEQAQERMSDEQMQEYFDRWENQFGGEHG